MPAAKQSRNGASATVTRKTTRKYVVVRVHDDQSLEVLGAQDARNQQEAMDKHVHSSPPGARSGRFAAFLASSYKQRDYKSEQTWTTESMDSIPGFLAGAEG